MENRKVQNLMLGQYRLAIKGQSFFVKPASKNWLSISTEVYDNSYDYSINEGLFTDEEFSQFLSEEGLWDEQSDDKIKSLRDGMEELKVRMFNNGFNTYELNKSRELLKTVMKDIEDLWAKKHSYTFLSASANASLDTMKFIFAGSLYDADDKLVVGDYKKYQKFPSSIIEYAINKYRDQKCSETEIRKIARTEPWRSYWACRKVENSLFGVPSYQLNDEQRNLVMWSLTYDNILEHPSCPPEDVINDDDILDGWLILQKREREKTTGGNQLDKIVKNEKIRNSGEVFIPVGTHKDMQKVASLNTNDASLLKRQRMNHLAAKGVVHEAEMPDSKNKIRQMAAEKFREAVKGE